MFNAKRFLHDSCNGSSIPAIVAIFAAMLSIGLGALESVAAMKKRSQKLWRIIWIIIEKKRVLSYS